MIYKNYKHCNSCKKDLQDLLPFRKLILFIKHGGNTLISKKIQRCLYTSRKLIFMLLLLKHNVLMKFKNIFAFDFSASFDNNVAVCFSVP